ncbi:hypothetical protein [Allorhodopirellula solitaria]|uniref:Uncharacterized protein n=1 Tax=Allorhodopirellula solitaria TaxID=2527987 RepID=A0A5C5X151_9BACT|nr:hypothetical protein [Allorhodopirellula solitaria]TWT56588.1 hypothetical protein CA85_41220 [Allorhodopirellula solitaria]
MFEIESAKIVLLGSFNPYIISPEWLKERSIWTPSDVRRNLGGGARDGAQFRGDGTEWIVTAERLVIASVTTDCGLLVDGLLAVLPHTPLSAVLSSFAFAITPSDSNAETTHDIFDAIRARTPRGFDAELLRWGVVLHRDQTRIDLTFVSGEQGVTVAVNHRRTARTANEARQAGNKFIGDRDVSEQLIRDMARPSA